jgi:hypothetical protein
MDVEIKLLVRDIANQIILDLQKNIRERRVTEFGAMNNTGEAAASLRWKIEGESLVIYSTMSGFNYIMTLETGRRPGKMPPVEPIQMWMQQRGINPPDISQKSLAFLIARRIGREGTKVYQEYTATGKGTGILLDVIGNKAYINENVRRPIIDKLAERFIQQMQGV